MSGSRDQGKALADDDDEEWEKMEEEEEDRSTVKYFIPFDIKQDYFSPLPPRTPAGTSSKDTSTDKEGKRINEEEEEEEKAKHVSNEGNASSSSTPLEQTASETEGSGKGNVDLPFNKLTIQDGDNDVTSQSKSGGGLCSSERANQEEIQGRAAINQRREYPKPKIARLGEFQRMVHFLFQMELTQSDVGRGRLSIPFQTAELYFPSTNRVSNCEWQILISDTRNDNWYMTLTYNPGVSTAFKFVIISGWQEFVDWHGLKSVDVIRFYKPIPRSHTKHYLIDYVKAEGNVVSPSKNSCMKQCRDDEVCHDVISESKFGRGSCSSERANQELQDNTDGQFHRRVFLFELQLTPSDIEQGMLFIPVQTAAKHFPPIQNLLPIYEHQIEISNTQNQNWNMTLVYNSSLHAFIITRGWHKFVLGHGLEVTDVICFYRPLLRLHNWHFLIQHVKSGEAETANPPEFKLENFLFELQMTSTSTYILFLPKKKVRKHFPAIQIPGGRRLRFTDAQNKDWCMTIYFTKDHDAYMLMDGWEGFVNKHILEDMDMIRFYKPVQPVHEGHFLIECVKREDADAGTTSQTDELGGGAKKDGNGGDCEDRGNGNHGGPAGPSHGGGSPGKRTTVCCRTKRNQRGGRKRAVMALDEFFRLTDSIWEEMALIPN